MENLTKKSENLVTGFSGRLIITDTESYIKLPFDDYSHLCSFKKSISRTMRFLLNYCDFDTKEKTLDAIENIQYLSFIIENCDLLDESYILDKTLNNK